MLHRLFEVAVQCNVLLQLLDVLGCTSERIGSLCKRDREITATHLLANCALALTVRQEFITAACELSPAGSE